MCNTVVFGGGGVTPSDQTLAAYFCAAYYIRGLRDSKFEVGMAQTL